MRLGLVGAGRWGRNYIRTIAALPDIMLAAIASRNSATADIAPDARIYDSWRALVQADDVEGVIIASPPSSHAEIMIAALDNGRAVLVEKPLVTQRWELAGIIAAAGRSDAAIMVDHIHLFHPAFRALKRECHERGGPIAIRSSAGDLSRHRGDIPVLWDWAPHDIAMALDLCAGPIAVRDVKVLAEQRLNNAIAQCVQILLQLPGGVPMSTIISTLDARHRWFAVDVAGGTLIYRDQSLAPLQYFDRPGASAIEKGRPLSVSSEQPLTEVVREFVTAICSHDSSRNSLNLGCQVVGLISSAEQLMQECVGGMGQ